MSNARRLGKMTAVLAASVVLVRMASWFGGLRVLLPRRRLRRRGINRRMAAAVGQSAAVLYAGGHAARRRVGDAAGGHPPPLRVIVQLRACSLERSGGAGWLALGQLPAHVVHVEVANGLDELLQGSCGHCARLGEDQNPVAEGHQRGD